MDRRKVGRRGRKDEGKRERRMKKEIHGGKKRQSKAKRKQYHYLKFQRILVFLLGE